MLKEIIRQTLIMTNVYSRIHWVPMYFEETTKQTSKFCDKFDSENKKLKHYHEMKAISKLQYC